MGNEYYDAGTPTYLNPETPALHQVPQSLRTYAHSLLCATLPPPSTMLVTDLRTGRTLRIDIDDFDSTLFARLERLTLGAAYAVVAVE